MDADSFAINNVILKARLFVATGLSSLDDDLKWIYKKESIFLKHWCFSIYCFFKLFQIDYFNEIDASLYFYPPPSIRVSMILNNIIAIMNPAGQKLNDFEMSSIKEMANEMLFYISKAVSDFDKITFNESNQDVFFSNHLNSTNYIDEIAKNWNNVRPLIENYAFGTLPPLVN